MRRWAVPLSLLTFFVLMAGLGWAGFQEPSRWSVGDHATYDVSTTAGDDLGTLEFSVGFPDWRIDATGRFEWAVPLTLLWQGPDATTVRTVWWSDHRVYSSLEGASDDLLHEAWLDGHWDTASVCPFAPTGCDGEPWPQHLEADLGPWLGSPGAGGTRHVLDRTGSEPGSEPWIPHESPYALPPLVPTPTEPWGPSGDADAGAAFDAFASDPAVAPVLGRGYVAVTWRHPFQALDGTPATSYQFVATDGDRVVERFVEPGPAPSIDPTLHVVARDQASVEPGLVPDRFPPDGPTALPDLDQIKERARHVPSVYHGAMESDRWGYWTACDGPSCRTVTTIVQVSQGTPRDGTFLRVDAEGDMVSWHERSPGALLQPARPDAPATQAPGPGWDWPSAGVTASVGFASVLVGALVYLAPHLRVPFIGGFTRLRRDSLLDSPTRRQIDETVHDHPGIHFRELARSTGLSPSTTRYHVRRLEEHGLVRTRGDGHRTGVWPADMAPDPTALWSPERRAVWDAVRSGADTMETLIKTLGRSRPTVIHHLDALESEGAVRRVRDGRRIRVEVVS